MKASPLILSLSLALLPAAQAAVEVRAQLVSAKEKAEKGEDGKPKAATASARGVGPRPVEQNKALEILVRNQSNKAEANLTVRYWLVGRDAKTSKLAMLDGGESQINLKPNASETITSEPVKSTYTPRPVFLQAAPRTAAGGKPAAGGAGAGGAAPKDASGTRISGHAVQVIKEGKVIAQDIMDEAIRTLIGSDGTKPGALFKAEKGEKAAE